MDLKSEVPLGFNRKLQTRIAKNSLKCLNSYAKELYGDSHSFRNYGQRTYVTVGSRVAKKRAERNKKSKEQSPQSDTSSDMLPAQQAAGTQSSNQPALTESTKRRTNPR